MGRRAVVGGRVVALVLGELVVAWAIGWAGCGFCAGWVLGVGPCPGTLGTGFMQRGDRGRCCLPVVVSDRGLLSESGAAADGVVAV